MDSAPAFKCRPNLAANTDPIQLFPNLNSAAAPCRQKRQARFLEVPTAYGGGCDGG